ncbi:MAG: zf-HC2 domain-containing protein [Lachnospiraceae bacterium]|nr:zf-HC2 domain-containing protein [Lachnospiraceae bacterium]
MDCIEFNGKINAYLKDELTDEELNEFLLHLRSCPKCNEELEINYIVSEGIERLDRKKADYNLSAAYEKAKDDSRRYIAGRKSMIRLSYVVGTVMFWMLGITVFVFFRILILGS